MAKAVMPWTWMRVLRDSGPRSRDFMCAMLTLHTWMDGDGFAYPSLRTWAAGSRMAIGTLRKHLKTATEGGWLGIEVCQATGKSWRRHTYRCAVPNDSVLSEKDELLAAALCSQHGDIRDGVSPMLDTPTRLNGHGVSPMSDTPSDPRESSRILATESAATVAKRFDNGSQHGEGVSNGHAKVCQNTPQGVSNAALRCVNQSDTEVSISEVLEVSIQDSEGAVASNNTVRVPSAMTSRPKTPELTGSARREAAKTLTMAAGISAAVNQYRLTRDEAEELLRECKMGHSRVTV